MQTIKEKINTAISFIRRKPKTSVFLAIIIIAIVFSIVSGGNTKNEQVTVVKGAVKEQVAVTGKTVSVHDVSLGFEKAGTIASTPVSVGSRVSKGQILATLDSSELSADLAKAKANLAQEVVKLETTRRGSALSFGDARANLVSKIKDAYVKTDDAIRNNVDTFFKNPRQSGNYIEFSFKDGGTEYRFPLDSDLQIKINSERYALEKVLNNWQTSLQSIDSAKDLDPYVLTAENNLNQTKSFLNTVALAANSIVATEYQYEATINGYKSTVSEARTSVFTAVTNLLAAKEKVTSAPKPITDTSGANTVFDDVLTQEARVEQFQAELDAVRAQLEKTIIRSPIDGLVTKQDAEVGEIVTSGTKLVSVISDAQMEIEANVSEVNIGKLQLNNTVSITFDAFLGQTYTGKVFYIEPAETIVDDVVNYKIKISIEGDIKDIKSGLTANLTIDTRSKENVLKVPRYSLLSKDGKTYIQKIVAGSKDIVNVEVTPGLIGSDGFVEITGDINEGDLIEIPATK